LVCDVDRRGSYAPGNRSLSRKAAALNRQELVIVGWFDPEGSSHHLGTVPLGYCTDDGPRGHGHAHQGARLRWRLDFITRKTSPPPLSTRFGSPLVLSRVHWADQKLIAKIEYLTWTADGLLRRSV
jgi:ATP-dependent DNA ligase